MGQDLQHHHPHQGLCDASPNRILSLGYRIFRARIPITPVMSTPSPEGLKGEHKTPPSESHKIPVEGTEYDRIARDSGIPKEQCAKVIEFKTAPKYDTLVPFLPKHPKEEEAALLVSYAFQVGLQQGTVDVSFLKRVLKDPNGYLLPSRGLGDILKALRRKKYLIACQAKKGRNKPFTLSEGGLTAARKLKLKEKTPLSSFFSLRLFEQSFL
jgi:hypothetical protein